MKRFVLPTLLLVAGTAFAFYQDYYYDYMTTIDSTKWYQNGSLTPTSQGLTSTSDDGGSLISKVAVPDGSSDYQLFGDLIMPTGGGTYYLYLRASSDARSGPNPTGSFYSVELQNPAWNGGTCTATLAIQKRVGGVLTLLGQTAVPCSADTNYMAIVRGDRIRVHGRVGFALDHLHLRHPGARHAPQRRHGDHVHRSHAARLGLPS